MAHDSQMAFFADAISSFPGHFSGRVLDVGSYDINGGPQHLFDAMEYVGVDLVPGPSVTLVGRAQELEFPDHHFDVTMSSECFEHNEAWPATLTNMIRMTRPSGLVILTAASTGRPEHGTRKSDGGWAFPGLSAVDRDWYRNLTRRAVMRVVRGAPLDFVGVSVDKGAGDLCFIGLVSPASPDDMTRAERVISLHAARTRGNAYPGSWSYRWVLTLFGDRGIRIATEVRKATHRAFGRSRGRGGAAHGT